MPIVGIVAGKTTISIARLAHALPDAVPALRSALDNYTSARSALLQALNADGGVAATLRVASQLAGNMDAWMRDNGATPLIPVRSVTTAGVFYIRPCSSVLTVSACSLWRSFCWEPATAICTKILLR